MQTAKVAFEGSTSIFNIDDLKDHIQGGFHAAGRFYEQRQLLAHRDVIPMNCSVIDVGANVGNHTIFYAKYTWAKRIYPFEPNPKARNLLCRNIASNGDFRASIETEQMHLGIGSRTSRLELVRPDLNNLGATQLRPIQNESGEAVDCRRLDDLQFEGHIAFIKIDVEGMEMDVLDGGDNIISKFRPIISIEISANHEAKFWEWVRSRRYQVISVFADYLHVKTYMAAPTAFVSVDSAKP